MSAALAGAAPLPPALASFEALWRARETDPLAPLREAAMRRLLRLGLPTNRDETWKYTNLRRVAATRYVDAPRLAAAGGDAGWRNESGPTLVLINGYPLPWAHDIGNGIEKNIEIISLRDLARTNPEVIAAHLEPLSDGDQGRWGLLNTALFADGLYVRITGELTQPLFIVHVASASRADSMAQPRVIVEVAPGAAATVVEHHVQQGEHAPLCNSATHIACGARSRVEHYRVYDTGADATHIDALTLRLDAHSLCRQFTVVLGGAMVRSSLDAALNQPGAELDSHALLVGHESRHVDCVNLVTHGARDTRSRQTARAIAGGVSRVVFNSKVVVDAGAVHADSRQSCRGLLLSPTAEIDTRPQLEIHADEVKCAHGATVGRLDPDMLFYMLSRGLDRQTAQSLLVYAFLADVLTGMAVPQARAAIEAALISQLPDSNILKEFR